MPINEDSILDDLVTLTDFGPRFHGSQNIALVANWIETQLATLSITVQRQSVRISGWDPGTRCRISTTEPFAREIRSWPMLWSGATSAPVTGRVTLLGQQGLWGDSMVWRKFIVKDVYDHAIGYLHARDDGPAAPQPLPSGSDLALPHFAIGHLDGLQLKEWIEDGFSVYVTIEMDARPCDDLESDNLIVNIPGTGPGLVLICAHYDTFWNTVGAYDNGSGTVTLLRLAQQLVSYPPRRSVQLVFFTGEEWHLSGSRAYVAIATPEELDRIDFVWNIDGIGSGDLLEAFAGPETFEAAFVAAIKEFADRDRPNLRLISRFPPTIGTDDAAFYDVGVPTGFLTFNNLNKLHQPNDLPTRGIARNVAWTIPLVHELIDCFDRPARWAFRQLL
jgi:hypothetical protein